MKKLQAAMRDISHRNSRELRHYYKVGSCFKGCHHCGEYEVEDGSSRKRYTSGFNVYRSYDPKWMRWTYWCWECGAKDGQAWENASDLGLPPIRGSKEAIAGHKKRRYQLLKDAVEFVAVPKPQEPSREQKIAHIESRLESLMRRFGGKA